MGCSLPEDWSQRSYQAGPVDMEVVQRGDSEFPCPVFGIFAGKIILFGAVRLSGRKRGWKILSVLFCHGVGNRTSAFVDAWLLGSKIRSLFPILLMGGYKNIGFVYNRDGYTRTGVRGCQTVSNTHIKRFNGKYYLYYCGSVDPGENARIKER